jgi:hypothetical protein
LSGKIFSVKLKGFRNSSRRTSPGCTGFNWVSNIVVPLVVIHYLYIICIIVTPIKTNSPPVVNTDTVLSSPIAGQSFQTIGRRNPQIIDCPGVIQHSQFTQSRLLNIAG